MDEMSASKIVIDLLPLVLITIVSGVTAHKLAKEKGRNVLLWTILGSIPVISFLFVWYFAGAANLRLERKLDQLVQDLEKQSR